MATYPTPAAATKGKTTAPGLARVAIGLALGEGGEKDARAIEFYEVLSTFRFVSSTPTLFNSGTRHPQLSSCYLSTVMDDLEHISR